MPLEAALSLLEENCEGPTEFGACLAALVTCVKVKGDQREVPFVRGSHCRITIIACVLFSFVCNHSFPSITATVCMCMCVCVCVRVCVCTHVCVECD
jgi:hypothetical protein